MRRPAAAFILFILTSIGKRMLQANVGESPPPSAPTRNFPALNKPPPPHRFNNRGEKHLTPRFGGRPRGVRQ